VIFGGYLHQLSPLFNRGYSFKYPFLYLAFGLIRMQRVLLK